MMAGFTLWFEGPDVMIAATLTTSMVIGLALFACCCKMKLTWLWAIMAAGTLAIFPLILFSIMYESKQIDTIVTFFIVIL